MTKLSVNLNKVALLRNARNIGIPSVIEAARSCIRAGAHGITVHPRPDERHIRRSDVYELAEMLTVEFNIEGNPVPRFMEIVRDAKPAQCTLVPDAPAQLTSDHGWDLAKEGERLRPIIADLKEMGMRVSLFMDPEARQIPLAKEVGADRIELYTEPYAAAHAVGDATASLELYGRCAKRAQELGLGVNAGHDLNRKNLTDFCAAVHGVLEVSIGHALIADALDMGLESTVKAYLRVLGEAPGSS